METIYQQIKALMLTKSAKGPHLNLHATQFNSKESLSQ